jgi:hypothetical protein
MIAVAYDRKIEIETVDTPEINRSLDAGRFNAATGFSPPAWNELVAEMAAADPRKWTRQSHRPPSAGADHERRHRQAHNLARRQHPNVGKITSALLGIFNSALTGFAVCWPTKAP